MTKTELLALADALDNLPTPEGFITDVEEAAAALCEYAATMDAEPVAWRYRWPATAQYLSTNWEYASTPEKPRLLEPSNGDRCELQPLYTHPPAPITSRTPLTYDELDKLFMDWNAKCWGSPSEAHHRFARAVLAAQEAKK